MSQQKYGDDGKMNDNKKDELGDWNRHVQDKDRMEGYNVRVVPLQITNKLRQMDQSKIMNEDKGGERCHKRLGRRQR